MEYTAPLFDFKLVMWLFLENGMLGDMSDKGLKSTNAFRLFLLSLSYDNEIPYLVGQFLQEAEGNVEQNPSALAEPRLVDSSWPPDT